MKDENIYEAAEEARRFLKRVEAYLVSKSTGQEPKYSFAPSQKRAAVRRSSMDLTKSLAKMRVDV